MNARLENVFYSSVLTIYCDILMKACCVVSLLSNV